MLGKKKLPYEPKKIETMGDICCMRCSEHYQRDNSPNSILLGGFWNYCSIDCVLEDEIYFQSFFASLEYSDAAELDRYPSFYRELEEAIRLHKDSIDIDKYINKAKRLRANKLVEILEHVSKK